MNYIQNIDQYGNIDTTDDGIIDESDANYQTDTLFTPIGIGADQVTGDFRGGFNDSNLIGACLDENNQFLEAEKGIRVLNLVPTK